MCIVLWILKPYPVTSCSPLHKAGSTDGKFEGNYCAVCYALYVQSQKVTQAHNCTDLGSPGRKDGEKKKKKDQLGTTSLLQKAACESVISVGNAPPELFAVFCFLISLGTESGLFFSRAAQAECLVSPGHSSQSCLPPRWSCLGQTLTTISQSFVLLRLSIQGLENAP